MDRRGLFSAGFLSRPDNSGKSVTNQTRLNSRMTSKKKTRLRRLIAGMILLFVAVGTAGMFMAYTFIFKSNLDLKGRPSVHIYIPTGSTFVEVREQFIRDGIIRNMRSFTWMAEKKNYPRHVMPGRYLLHQDMGNNELINLLRSGKQDPVMVTFNNVRTKEQLSGILSRQLEPDSLSIIRLLNDPAVLSDYGKNVHTIPLLFIPNTYEFFWDTSARQILDRMQREYQAFWNETRQQRAGAMGFSPEEVGIIASIVERETTRTDEMDRVAGVYINRLRRNMPLQADPTIIFALGDFGITRVLTRHLAIDSPYNTYINRGLPPGPISFPEPGVIDKVLQYEDHDFLYFCARADLSGYHAFAETYGEHLINARKYHRALNERGIMN